MPEFKVIDQRGFTLVELLVVVMIIAAIAGGVVLSFDDTQDEAGLQISRSEIVKIKEAVLKFKQDTGYLPKLGPFDLASPNQCGTTPGSVPLPAEGKDWFCSPANFVQLYENPLEGTGHRLENWNSNTRRGWRGPYLSRVGEGRLDLGDSLQANGTGSPTTVVTSALVNVYGIADPFVSRPVNPGSYGRCENPTESNCLLDWRIASSQPTHDRWGRPYFYFPLDINDTTGTNFDHRIVGMGKNRTYDLGLGDDIVVELLK